jgi:predicted house-cleaning NTP pyrophosphatase (Maf/HAM1 superfamily)
VTTSGRRRNLITFLQQVFHMDERDRAIYRPVESAADLAEHKARAAEALAKARAILRQPSPDTFLGRQHYELITLPSEEE